MGSYRDIIIVIVWSIVRWIIFGRFLSIFIVWIVVIRNCVIIIWVRWFVYVERFNVRGFYICYFVMIII